MRLCNNSSVLITSGGDMTLKKQDLNTGKFQHNSENKFHDDKITRIAISHDEVYIFTGSQDCHLKQWKLDTFELVKDWGRVHDNYVSFQVIVPDGQYLFTGSFDKHIKQWDIIQQKLVKDYGPVHVDYICAQLVDKDGKYQWSSGWDGFVKKWDICKQKLVKSFDLNEIGGGRYDIWCMGMTNDQTNLYVGGGNMYGNSSQKHLKIFELDQDEKRLYDEQKSLQSQNNGSMISKIKTFFGRGNINI